MKALIKCYPYNCESVFQNEVWMENSWGRLVKDYNEFIKPGLNYAICYDAKENSVPEDYSYEKKQKTEINGYGEEETFTYYEAILKTQ